ncbi:hypothetical protein ACS2QQ_27425 [Bacillus cereus group sp. Bce032]|uniref:hypothetical protein n=1 Tax=Bacillus cereus group sp. Bce032 TaxID=3445236 RepID=UPI003F206C8B
MNLEEIKLIPRLKIKKVKITDSFYLKQLMFPEMFVAPIGTYKTKEEREKEQKEKEQQQKPKKETNEKEKKPKKEKKESIIDGIKFDEQLKNGEIEFYYYLPKRSESIPAYGVKYVDVDVKYKGAGLYQIFTESGLKLPMDKDNRNVEANPDFGKHKEEIYVAYQEVEEETDEIDENGEKKKIIVKRYKRVSKKTFNSLVEELTELKIQPEIADMLLHYQEFFEKVFLRAATFHSQFQEFIHLDVTQTFYDYANILYNGSQKMKEIYDFYFAIGAIEELSHERIHQQIKAVEDNTKELLKLLDYETHHELFELKLIKHPNDQAIFDMYKKIKKIVINMVEDRVWFNAFTGEFFFNAQSFYWEYIPSKKFNSKQTKELQRELTAIDCILNNYADSHMRELKTLKKELPKDGIFYIPLIEETRSEELSKRYNQSFEKLKKMYDAKSFDEWEKVSYLFEEKPLVTGESEEE